MSKRIQIALHISMALVLLVGFSCIGQDAFADDTGTVEWETFELLPIRYITVKGDAAKFRAHTWMNDGSTGGIKNMGFTSTLGELGDVTFQGHAIPDDHDLGASLKLMLDKGGYVTLDYSNFRKWYSPWGGQYPKFFGANSVQRVDADPALDIGKFFFEVGSSSDGSPGVSLSYTRDTKEGIKSSTIWGGLNQGVNRYILPAWTDTSLVNDKIALKGNVDVAGFNVSGEQSWDLLDGRKFREEESGGQFTSQSFEPMSKILTSSLKADRWLKEDKTHVSFAYRFRHARTNTQEQIREYLVSGVTNNDSHNSVIDSDAASDAHTWVQSLHTKLTKNLTLGVNLKQEVYASKSDGVAVGYSGGNDETADAENEVTRIGEQVSLRYSGIPKTSIYTDWDFQQTRNWEYKSEVGTSAAEIIERNPQMNGVIGIRYVPNGKFNATSQYKYKSDRSTYNTLYNTGDDALDFNRLRTTTNEVSTRLTWKPLKWFQNSFRVKVGDTKYRKQDYDHASGFTNNSDWLKSELDSQSYTYSVLLQPTDQCMFDLGYSYSDQKVSTPADQLDTSAGGIQEFQANIHTWLATATYVPNEKVSFFGTAQYSDAGDYDSYDFGGMPYGTEYKSMDFSLGLQWKPKKDITVEPRYAYYNYRADPVSLDYGNYSAHVIWLGVDLDWF